jgi:hypothetical protein
MGDGRILHPIHEGNVVGVPLAVNFGCLDDMKVVVKRWHLSEQVLWLGCAKFPRSTRPDRIPVAGAGQSPRRISQKSRHG